MNEETLFHLALEKSPDERGAFLDEACAAMSCCAERVEVLLRAHDASGSFLDRPLIAGAAAVDRTLDRPGFPRNVRIPLPKPQPGPPWAGARRCGAWKPRSANSATTNSWKRSPGAAWAWSTRRGRYRSTALSR